MRTRPWLKLASGCAIAAAVLIACTIFPHTRVKAQSAGPNGDSRIQIGLAAAPVPLNLTGRNPALVGLGSYYVNVVGDCNGCHSAGPQTEFVRGGNPYMNQPTRVNPATYLGGGRDFGPLIPGSAHIISRNLTPDSTGLPEGGATLADFIHTIRTGLDDDHLHPTCTGAPNAGCIPPPFDGDLLQIMPWPTLRAISDNDLRAIYEYLSAIPCVQGNYPGESPHRCG